MAYSLGAAFLVAIAIALLRLRKRPSPRQEFIFHAVAWLSQSESAPPDSIAPPDKNAALRMRREAS